MNKTQQALTTLLVSLYGEPEYNKVYPMPKLRQFVKKNDIESALETGDAWYLIRLFRKRMEMCGEKIPSNIQRALRTLTKTFPDSPPFSARFPLAE